MAILSAVRGSAVAEGSNPFLRRMWRSLANRLLCWCWSRRLYLPFLFDASLTVQVHSGSDWLVEAVMPDVCHYSSCVWPRVFSQWYLFRLFFLIFLSMIWNCSLIWLLSIIIQWYNDSIREMTDIIDVAVMRRVGVETARSGLNRYSAIEAMIFFHDVLSIIGWLLFGVAY